MVIERWKATAEIFVKNNTKAFIKDMKQNFYFCDIILVGEDTVMVKCFEPPKMKDKKFRLYWTLIEQFEEYEKGKQND